MKTIRLLAILLASLMGQCLQAQPPVITGFLPMSGRIGTMVTITGSGFSTTGNNIVYFGAVKAPIIHTTANSLTVKVPTGTNFAPVTVTSNGLTAHSGKRFTVTFTGAANITASSFENTQYFFGSAMYNTHKFIVEDFDDDGKTDRASASVYYHVLSVFKNTSEQAIGFAAPLELPLLTNTFPLVTAADLDGDGLKDLLVSNTPYDNISTPNTKFVSLFRNTSTPGNISFATRMDIPVVDSVYAINATDINADGRTDILISRRSVDTTCSFLGNSSSPGNMAFTGEQWIPFVGQLMRTVDDIDQDGKDDIITSVGIKDSFAIWRNLSNGGNINFAPPVFFLANGAGYPWEYKTGDLNKDGKPDIVVSQTGSGNNISVLINQSTPGTIALANPVNFITGNEARSLDIGDLNGDSWPDIAVVHRSANFTTGTNINVFKNNTTTVGGAIALAPAVSYTAVIPNAPAPNLTGMNLADWDGDGKLDLGPATQFWGWLGTLRNKMGDAAKLCPPAASISFASTVSGTNYQWQVSTDSVNFFDINNGVNYSGSTTASLSLLAVPSAWYGYQYRCLVDNGLYSDVFTIAFLNRWIGTSNTAWENPANWSCGVVPDMNTDVQINSGTVLISNNTTVRSLTVRPGASLTIAPNVVLTVLH